MTPPIAHVRVRRAPGFRGGSLSLWVEVSSDGGETWAVLPTPADSDTALHSSGRHGCAHVVVPVALIGALGGSVDLAGPVDGDVQPAYERVGDASS